MADSKSDPLIPDVHRTHGGATLTKKSYHDTYPYITPTQFDLSGRVALISGASYGIGQNIAVAYTQARISGLILTARSDLSETVSIVEKAANEAGVPTPKILCLKVDVTVASSVEAAAADVKKTWSEGIDIVVSNAGYLEPELSVVDSDPEEWWNSLAINLKGPYLISRSFIPLLLLKKDGLKTILNMTSIGAHMIFPGMSAYNTAKLALCRLTEYTDAEYANQGVISLTMHPGGVKTAMGMKLPLEKQAMLTDSPELVADSVVWCTAVRREWLSGRYVSVQWDMKALENNKEEIVERDLLKAKLEAGGEGWQ